MRAWQGWHAISCYACGRNLAYQSGAAVVKCPGCESVLNVRGLPLSEVAGQAECTGCNQIMVFRAEGASLNIGLVCTTCASYTRVPPSYFYNCRGCGLYVTYCARLPCVICAVCRTVYPPTPAPTPYPTLALAPLVPGLHRPPRLPPALPPRRFALLRSTPVTPVPGPRPGQMPRTPQARARMPARPVPPEPPPSAAGYVPPLTPATAAQESAALPGQATASETAALSHAAPAATTHAGAPATLVVQVTGTAALATSHEGHPLGQPEQPEQPGQPGQPGQSGQPVQPVPVEPAVHTSQPPPMPPRAAHQRPQSGPQGRRLRWTPKAKGTRRGTSSSDASASHTPPVGDVQEGQPQQSEPQQSQVPVPNGDDTGTGDASAERSTAEK